MIMCQCLLLTSCISKAFYEVIVQVHVMDFKQFSSLPLFTWSGFFLGGPGQPQCPGPLARHLAEGQQGQANPKSAGHYRRPLQRPIPEELHLFKGGERATQELVKSCQPCYP